MDARVDGFEDRVQKRLEGARPADMAIVQRELAMFKADLMTSLAAPIAAPEEAHVGEDLINLFEDRPCAPRKRLMEGDDADLAQKRQRTTEEEAELEEAITELVVSLWRQRSRGRLGSSRYCMELAHLVHLSPDHPGGERAPDQTDAGA